MIDIHCHILPGLDDGPQKLAISKAMAEIAAGDGIRTIIATPHTDGIRVNRTTVENGVRELNRELVRHGIPVGILPGYELPYHLAEELAAEHTLAASRYVLIEFPHMYIPQDALATVYRLLDRQLYPVIAHPERNAGILEKTDRLVPLIEAGALSQLTAASITGDLGPDLQLCALHLLKSSMAHFIATDSHSPRFRKPVLTGAHTIASKMLGRGRADLLIRQNPQRIISDAKL